MKLSTAILILFVCTFSGWSQANQKSDGVVLKLSVDDPNYDPYFIDVNLKKTGAIKSENGGVAKDSGPDYAGPTLPPGYLYRWKTRVLAKDSVTINIWVEVRDLELIGCRMSKRMVISKTPRTFSYPRCRIKGTIYLGNNPATE